MSAFNTTRLPAAAWIAGVAAAILSALMAMTASRKTAHAESLEDPSVTANAHEEPKDFKLALEEARRGMDSLDKQFADVRNRSMQLVSVGGLAASIVGGLAALGGPKLGIWGLYALGAFAVIVFLCVWIWWPREMWTTQKASTLVEWAETPDVTRSDMDKELAEYLDSQYTANAKLAQRLMKGFTCQLVFLLIEIGFVTVGLLWGS
jgi:hypothetical protein